MMLNIAVAKAVLGPVRKDETPEDVVKAMREYADAMDVRQKEAVESDRYLPCSCMALRMREFALRTEKALARQAEESTGTKRTAGRRKS